MPSGPTFPPSAVSNPGTIGTGPSFRPESNPNGSDFFGGIGSASFSSPSLVAVVVIRFFCIFIRLIRRVLLDDAEGNLPQRLVVALLVVVVANISLYSLSALKVCVCVCVSVCLSFFSLEVV